MGELWGDFYLFFKKEMTMRFREYIVLYFVFFRHLRPYVRPRAPWYSGSARPQPKLQTLWPRCPTKRTNPPPPLPSKKRKPRRWRPLPKPPNQRLPSLNPHLRQRKVTYHAFLTGRPPTKNLQMTFSVSVSSKKIMYVDSKFTAVWSSVSI